MFNSIKKAIARRFGKASTRPAIKVTTANTTTAKVTNEADIRKDLELRLIRCLNSAIPKLQMNRLRAMVDAANAFCCYDSAARALLNDAGVAVFGSSWENILDCKWEAFCAGIEYCDVKSTLDEGNWELAAEHIQDVFDAVESGKYTFYAGARHLDDLAAEISWEFQKTDFATDTWVLKFVDWYSIAKTYANGYGNDTNGDFTSRGFFSFQVIDFEG